MAIPSAETPRRRYIKTSCKILIGHHDKSEGCVLRPNGITGGDGFRKFLMHR